MNPLHGFLKAFQAGLFAVSLALCIEARAQLLIDTGPNIPDATGASLFNENGVFQSLAGKVTFATPVTISGIEGWMGSVTSGRVNIQLTKDETDAPGAVLFHDSFYLGKTVGQNTPPNVWAGISNESWTVNSGSYWITFAAQPGFSGYMPNPGDPSISGFHPLEEYEVTFTNTSDGFVDWWHGVDNLGVRVYGIEGTPPMSPVPEPATYGLAAAALLAAGILVRRRRAAA